MTASADAGGYGSEQPYISAEDAPRHQALTRAAGGVRVRVGIDLPVEQILLVGGSILLPLGVVLILLGWYGAAHTGHTYAQIDYLISGGLLGIALSVAGGFMYFGYWLSRQLGESRRQNALTLRALERLERTVEGAATTDRASSYAGPSDLTPPTGTPAIAVDEWAPPTSRPVTAPAAAAGGTVAVASRNSAGGSAAGGSAAGGSARTPTKRSGAAPSAGAVSPNGAGPMLVATPRGTLLHRPECPVVARRPEVRQLAAGTEGFGYCTMCDAAGVVS